MMIYTHKYRINAGLALINGAYQLSETWYWSSTEQNVNTVWYLGLWGELFCASKINETYKARPVSAFIHEGY